MARKKRSASIESADEAAINPAPSTAPKKKGRAASVKSVAVKSKFSNKITTPFAEKGLKSPFPDAPQGDGLINQQEGFTLKYRTPINAGGAYIKMENFNQIINETQKALKETQEKCVTSVNGSAADETGNVAIDVSGLVKSVNETLPDVTGNIALGNLVKSVNEIAPDDNGNADIGAIVHSVNNIAPDNVGNVTVPNTPDMTKATGVLPMANGGTGNNAGVAAGLWGYNGFDINRYITDIGYQAVPVISSGERDGGGWLNLQLLKNAILAGAPKISIVTGKVAHGAFIPLPYGYSEYQCKWIISPDDRQVDDDDTMHCFTSAQVLDRNSYGRIATNYTSQRGGRVSNYIIIGVK